MLPLDEHERVMADLISQALMGQLRLSLNDLPRVVQAASQVDPARIAPLALTRWISRDPRAADLLRRLRRP